MKNKKEKQAKDFLCNNENALEKIVTIISEVYKADAKHAGEIKDHLRPTLTEAYYNSHISKYKSISRAELFSDVNVSSEMNSYYLNVVRDLDFVKKKTSGNKTENVMKKLNGKINEVANNIPVLNKEGRQKLAFLSILKHSYYFWSR